MHASIPLFLNLAALALAKPIDLEVRTVAALNTAAFEEAQQRDNTATRAFANTQIKTSEGKCLFINDLSGDFRANLNPIQVGTCDNSKGQLWDVITKGKHDDQAGTMLLVNTLTQACMNFDPRRAAGNTVIMFSCGGRADGGGAVTNSQLFNFTAGGAGPLALSPLNAVGTCLTVTAGDVLDSAACSGAGTQEFTFGGGSAAPVAAGTTTTATTASTAATKSSALSEIAAATSSACTSTVLVTQTRSVAEACLASTATISTSSSAPAAITTAPNPAGEITANPTTPLPVSGAGGTLNPSAAAESNPRDASAIRAFTSVSLRTSTNLCLTINPLAGDFRQNLIPISLSPCSASLTQKFDFITSGLHNNAANSTLIVSSLTQGCVNFDGRRKAGNQVLLFSCGGRADGGGATTNSQLFGFTTTDVGSKRVVLSPQSGPRGVVCLVGNAGTGLLDQAACDGSAEQVFTIG